MGGKGMMRYAARMLVLVGCSLFVFFFWGGGDPDPFSGLKMMESHSNDFSCLCDVKGGTYSKPPWKFNRSPLKKQITWGTFQGIGICL